MCAHCDDRWVTGTVIVSKELLWLKRQCIKRVRETIQHRNDGGCGESPKSSETPDLHHSIHTADDSRLRAMWLRLWHTSEESIERASERRQEDKRINLSSRTGWENTWESLRERQTTAEIEWQCAKTTVLFTEQVSPLEYKLVCEILTKYQQFWSSDFSAATKINDSDDSGWGFSGRKWFDRKKEFKWIFFANWIFLTPFQLLFLALPSTDFHSRSLTPPFSISLSPHSRHTLLTYKNAMWARSQHTSNW